MNQINPDDEKMQNMSEMGNAHLNHEHSRKRTYRKNKSSFIYNMFICLFGAVFLISIYKISSDYIEYHRSAKFYDNMASSVVSINDTSNEVSESSISSTVPDDTGKKEKVPITVDFEMLRKQSEDIVAWLYCENSPINYPVVCGNDNAYYLHRLYDGSNNSGGTLFLDYRNSEDFSDGNSVIYGHNMKDGSMFGSLVKYKDGSYYGEHPVLYLLTEEHNYMIEIFAGCVVDYMSELYNRDAASVANIIQLALSKSNFTTNVSITDSDRLITLSTCSYEFDNARYVIVGKLTEKTEEGRD